MTGTIKSILAADVISLARSTPSGDYYDPDHVEATADFVANLALHEDQIADVGAWAVPDIEEIAGRKIRVWGYCDLWLSNQEDAPATRYLLGDFIE